MWCLLFGGLYLVNLELETVLHPGSIVLDVGCGAGHIPHKIRKQSNNSVFPGVLTFPVNNRQFGS